MTETTGFDAYMMYSSLKLHFAGSFDYFKYNGKIKLTRDNFEKAKGKYQFYKLSRKYNLQDLRDFYVSNFIDGNIEWIGEMSTIESEERYLKWKKRNQSLTYRFKQDIMHMLDVFQDAESMLKVTEGQHPPLLREMLIGIVSIETVVILNDILNFFPMWSKNIQEDVLWPSLEMKMTKYAPFVNYDKKKYIALLKEMINEHAEA